MEELEVTAAGIAEAGSTCLAIFWFTHGFTHEAQKRKWLTTVKL